MTTRPPGPRSPPSTTSSACSVSPTPAPATRAAPALLDVDRDWLAASPFCVMATASATGECDASPKGDPAGQLVHVIDDRTIALAERPGNRRADGYKNILREPARRAELLHPRPRRHAAHQRPRPAGQRRAVLRRDGRQGAPAAAGRGRRDRGDVLPLREGVPALGAVEAGDLGPRGDGAAARGDRQGGRGERHDASRSSTSTTSPRTTRRGCMPELPLPQGPRHRERLRAAARPRRLACTATCAAERVRALCDRRAGIGGDGVLRVVRRGRAAGSWTTATPTARSRRCAATASGSSPGTWSRRGWSTRPRRSRSTPATASRC